jgi:hypothetical protein
MEAKDIRSIQEAYLEMYENINEAVFDPKKSRMRPASERTRDAITPQRRAQLEKERKNREDLEHAGNLALAGMQSSGERGRVQTTPTPKPAVPQANRKVTGGKDRLAAKANKILKSLQSESYDIYDVVLSHLLDEGYADTYESAEAIMVNMSEDWKDSILDEARWGGRGYREPIGGPDQNMSRRNRYMGGGTPEDEAYDRARGDAAAAAAKRRLHANLAREAARKKG